MLRIARGPAGAAGDEMGRSLRTSSGLELRVSDLGFRVQGLEFRVQGLGSRVEGLRSIGFRV